jgi:hypothetical protein
MSRRPQKKKASAQGGGRPAVICTVAVVVGVALWYGGSSGRDDVTAAPVSDDQLHVCGMWDVCLCVCVLLVRILTDPHAQAERELAPSSSTHTVHCLNSSPNSSPAILPYV